VNNMRFLERFIVVILPILILFILNVLKISSVEIAKLDIFIGSLISAVATIVGFIIAIIAILIGVLDKQIMKIIHEKKSMNLLREYLFVPVVIGSLLIILSFVALIMCDKVVAGMLFKIFLFLIISFVIANIRLGIIMIYLFKEISEEYFETESKEKILRDDQI